MMKCHSLFSTYFSVFFATLVFTADTLFAQRNFIDVPSSDIVAKSQYFFQAQSEISAEEISSSWLFTYGLGYNWEAGIGIENLNYSRGRGIAFDAENMSENPGYLLNVQKGFALTSSVNAGIGTRAGVAHAAKVSDVEWLSFTYANIHTSVANDLFQFSVGGFYGNRAYLQEGKGWGVMGGTQTTLVREKINFQADFLSGVGRASVINTGFEFTLPRDWKLTLGVQFPFFGRTDQPTAALIQIAKE